MNAAISVYLRDHQVIVVPQGGSGGVYYELDDVKLVPPSEPDVQRALEDAIQASMRAADQPTPNLRTMEWVVPKRVGLKSSRAFYVNVSHASVFLYDNKIEVFADRPAKNNKGFELDRGPFPVDNISSLGSVVLRVLNEAPRMRPA